MFKKQSLMLIKKNEQNLMAELYKCALYQT